MKSRRFKLGLLNLALAWLMLTGAAGAEKIEPFPSLLGPAGWVRVDGQDHDLDEMLSRLRPPGAETLAIFAPPQRWKPFYDKVYGRNPIDLALYAAIYRLLPGGPEPPSLNDWPVFYQETPTESEATTSLPPGEPLSPPFSEMVTFKTTLPSAGHNDDGQTIYTIFVSLVLDRRQIFFLNLFQIDPDDSAELEDLALSWRIKFLEAKEESQSDQTLE